jgi:hypothetical protein
MAKKPGRVRYLDEMPIATSCSWMCRTWRTLRAIYWPKRGQHWTTLEEASWSGRGQPEDTLRSDGDTYWTANKGCVSGEVAETGYKTWYVNEHHHSTSASSMTTPQEDAPPAYPNQDTFETWTLSPEHPDPLVP